MALAKPKSKSEIRWTASPESILRLHDLYELRQQKAMERLKRYYDDPVAFAYDCIVWPIDPRTEKPQSLTPYQEEVLTALAEHSRVAQQGPRGLGKSTTNSIALLWFAFTRDAMGVDWKCITTAGGWHQLEQYLWPEIHKWANRLTWTTLGRDPFRSGELLRLNLKLTWGTASAAASNNPARIEGAHADAILFIFDEAKIIEVATFDAAEGSFSGPGESLALVSSTPGEPNGRFYDICTGKKGLEKWWHRHVTITEAVAAGIVAQEWVDDHKQLWGEESALYYNHVLGEFHSDDEHTIIPLPWVEAAVQRWHDHTFASKLDPKRHEYDPIPAMDRVGVDVANAGEDATVFALIHGPRVDGFLSWHGADTTAVITSLDEVHALHPGVTSVVDADGIGIGVYDGVKNKGRPVVAFHASASTEKKDKTGELEFLNVRAAAWWQLREELDPRNNPTLELPDHDILLGDLSAPKWSEVGRGKIKVEAKEDIKKRLGRSPDFGDAVMMGRWRDRVKRRRQMSFAGRQT